MRATVHNALLIPLATCVALACGCDGKTAASPPDAAVDAAADAATDGGTDAADDAAADAPADGSPDGGDPNCEVQSLERMGQGWYPTWHPTQDLIVFNDRVDPGGIMEIFTARPDGTEVTCLTCGKDIPGTYQSGGQHGHRGEPAWHPSGDYIVFLATNEHGDLVLSIPGLGPNNDVFLMTADGNQYWQLTDMPPKWGVGGPGFSHAGDKIEWIEEYSCERPDCPDPKLDAGECGSLPLAECQCCAPLDERSLERNQGEDFLLLRVKTADFSIDGSGPHVGPLQTVQLNHGGKRLLDHGTGFTPDDQHFIFKSADITETNGRPFCADLYTSNLAGELSSFDRLTHTLDAHEENTSFSRSGNKVAFTSGPLVGYVFYKLDLYVMDPDGSNKQRVTFFNEPGAPEYDGQLHYVDEGTWSPDGTQYYVSVFDHQSHFVNADDWSGNFCSGANMPEYWNRIAWQQANALDIYLNIVARIYRVTFAGPCGG